MLRGTVDFINFIRSYSVFPVFVETSSRSNFLIFFLFRYEDKRGPVGAENMVSKFQRPTRRFTGALCMPTAAGNLTLDQLVYIFTCANLLQFLITVGDFIEHNWCTMRG